MDPQYYSNCNSGLEALAALSNIESLNTPLVFEDDDYSIELGDTIVDPTPTIEEQIIAKETIGEMKGEIGQFLNSLSPYLQCIVVRTYWFGQTPQQIANDLGRKRSTIYKALSRVPGLGREFYGQIGVA